MTHPEQQSQPAVEREVPRSYRVAVVGATGLVGSEMVSQLEGKEFVGELVLFGSSRSAGRRIAWRDRELTVRTLSPKNIRGFDLALFSAGSEVSATWASRFAATGCTVIDNSSQWRMNPSVPLVAAGVNDHALETFVRRWDVERLSDDLARAGLAHRVLESEDGRYLFEIAPEATTEKQF